MSLFHNTWDHGLNETQKALLSRFLGPLSTAVLLMQLLEDILLVLPDYPDNLVNRLDAALEVATDRLSRRDQLDEDEALYPESVPFELLDGSFDKRDARDLAGLYRAISLTGRHESNNLEWVVTAGQLVAICSAIESLADDLGIAKRDPDNKPIPLIHRVSMALDPGSPKPRMPDSHKDLRELIDARNIIVHERGRLNIRAWKPAQSTTQIPGDALVLNQRRFMELLRLVEEVGTSMVRTAT